jgi:ABC-2 type transport system permease protein
VISLRRLQTILAHELRLAARDPVTVLVLVVFPIITMAFVKPAFRAALQQSGYPHATGAEQVVPGQAVMSAFFIVSVTTFAFFSEYAYRTWDRVRSSPASSIEIVVGKATPRVAMVVAQLLVVIGAGVVLFDLHFSGDAIALLPLILLFAVTLVLLGVAITALAHSAQQASAIAFVGMVLFGAIGGALVPLSVLPHWAKPFAPATPTYWAMRGFNSVILDGRGWGAMAAPVVALLAMSLGFAAVALRKLRFDAAKDVFVY